MKSLSAHLLANLFAAVAFAATGPSEPAPRLGMNLAGPADFSTELPFVDVFRLSREWISQREGEPWGKGPKLDLDENGWIKRLEPGCSADTPVCTIEGGHFPSGTYTVLYDGAGKITFHNTAVASEEPGRTLLDVDSSKGGFFVQIRETDESNPIRNIRILMPGFETSHATQVFHPAFLDRWKGFACFRFMDWMLTNGSPVRSWADRPKVSDSTWTTKGVPLEVMIDLCNRQKVSPWFCMPHLADDDYVRRFAEMTKAKLDPSLKVHVEYSNEVWNGMFPQHRYAAQKAAELGIGPGDRPWEQAAMYYSTRSVEIFNIWKEVLGDSGRLVRVLAWQAAADPNYWIENIIFGTADAGAKADALALAPYMTMCVPGQGDGDLTAANVAGWSVDQVLDYLENKALPEAEGWMRSQRAVAAGRGLKLLCYEAGQHAVGVLGGENNEAMTALFIAANRHPRMESIYAKYLDAWAGNGGDLMAIFSSVGGFGKWGSWGIMEYADSAPEDSPKLRAVIDWAKKRGQPVRMPSRP